MRWLLASPLRFGIAALAIILALAALLSYCNSRADDHDEAVYNQGVQTERADTQQEVLNDVHEATDARDRPTDAERNVVCSKYDRTCPNGQ